MFEIIRDFEQQAETVFCSRKKVADLGSLRVFFWGGGGIGQITKEGDIRWSPILDIVECHKKNWQIMIFQVKN